MIYLDYNATSPLRPSVATAMAEVAMEPLNPSSIHGAGRRAKKLLEDARATIAQSLSAFPNEIIFTSSATEANLTVLRAFANERPMLTSSIEHASCGKAGRLLGATKIDVDAQGVLKLDQLEEKLKALGTPALVSVMLANNETGAIQPIAEIARIVHAHGGLLHCDAVQGLGKMPVDWGLLGADMLTICAHKVGGPVGVGALLVRNDLPIKPLFLGGGQELGRRAGTENIPYIVGFAALVKEVANCSEAAEMERLRDWLQAELLAAAPDAIVFSSDVARLPNTLQLTMPGVESVTQLMNFDLAGFALSAGSACSSGRVEASHVLLAMGVAKEVAQTAIRISLGWGTTQTEVEKFADAWKAAYSRLRKQAA
jgi:cysteine desulfurase